MQDWVIRLIDWGGYPAVFLLSLLESLVLPMPSEVILPIAGLRAANGPLDLTGVIAASTAGSMTGNTIWYLAARTIELDRLRGFIERHGRWLALEWRDVERVQRLFGRFGSGIVFIGRLLPFIRTVVSIPAGLLRMRLVPYLLWSTIGTASFATVFAGAGYLAGERFGRIEEIAGPISSAIIIGIVAWYVWSQLTWHRRVGLRALPETEADDGDKNKSS